MGRALGRTDETRYRTQRIWVRYAFAAILILLNVWLPRAQGGVAISMHQMPLVPEADITKAITLRTGIGLSHDAVAGTSPEAQRFYDQGLSYLHDYAWIEAARSFNQALRLDPKLSLAQVGLSAAYLQLNQRAPSKAAIERARTIGPPGEHERVHLTVAERRRAAEDAPGNAALVAEYRKALDAAIERFPRDVELLLQRGTAESADAADRGQSSPMSAVPFYNRALTVAPDHFAAHHYLTHAFENGGRIQEALTHGAAFARLAPNVAHARHMHGHNLRRVGRIKDALAEFQVADRLETEYFAAEGTRPEHDWHYEHNLDLLGTSYQYVGQVRRASAILEQAFKLPSANLVQLTNKRGWPMLLRTLERYDDALAAARTLIGHPNTVVQAFGHIEAAHVFMERAQMTDAAREANAAVAALRNAPGSGLAAIPMQVLQGEFFLRSGQREKGRTTLEAAIRQARRATGPDEWSRALFTLESIARAARAGGDWTLVGFAAAQMLEHDPSYAGTHYALGLVAEQRGDRTTATQEFTRAQTLWADADADLPALVDLGNGLAGRR